MDARLHLNSDLILITIGTKGDSSGHTHLYKLCFFLVLELVSKYTKINDCLILTSNEVQEVKVCNVVY